MTDKKKLGDRGEDYTARYLEKQGFHIVERNWHSCCYRTEAAKVAVHGGKLPVGTSHRSPATI